MDSRPTSEVLRFGAPTLGFMPLPDLLVPRSLLTSAALPDDRLVISGVGGEVPDGAATNVLIRK